MSKCLCRPPGLEVMVGSLPLKPWSGGAQGQSPSESLIGTNRVVLGIAKFSQVRPVEGLSRIQFRCPSKIPSRFTEVILAERICLKQTQSMVVTGVARIKSDSELKVRGIKTATQQGSYGNPHRLARQQDPRNGNHQDHCQPGQLRTQSNADFRILRQQEPRPTAS